MAAGRLAHLVRAPLYSLVVMVSDNSEGHGRRLSRGLHTSIVDNSSAFGFSIMITGSFAVLGELLGKPVVGEIFGFALAAALTLTLFLGASSHGFRRSLETAHREVVLLGVAMNFVSVGAGVGAAALAGAIVSSWPAWPIGAFTAVSVYIGAESAELALAELAQRRRGDSQVT